MKTEFKEGDKFVLEICKGINCPECSFNKGEDGCLLAERLNEIKVTSEPCDEHRHFLKILRELPPAQPERTKGRWIKMSDADGVYYCCSECGEELYRLWSFDREFDLVPHKVSIAQTRYCPNCGADMRGEE